ncbi:hypothetical protein MYCTH_91240 [Thermothelomyces thermophilus ATCC 42464]|uniref:Uncharacterized protein n=1 Tax=Thermothelomyces thermophilus (strain ATCC 42464 / BCRC 31852 / DSM 1799) TaxID=573729 RepID=G2Q4Z7_THET4|nr:uncharacterized protein MYCTH_91240 [Thermothelomyces thermophilus ATCC 42464]AEO53734.1 hypothetical protein MYCTH_91240 [Thermothelomyces thermophilus ATCC 42464]
MLCPRSPSDGTARIDILGSPPARAYHSPFHISNMSQFGRWANAGHVQNSMYYMAKSARGRPSRWTGPGGETSKPSNHAGYFVHTYVNMTQIAKAGKGTASDGVTRRLRPPIPGPTLRAAITRLALYPEKGKGGHSTRVAGLIKHVPRLPSVCGAYVHSHFKHIRTFASALANHRPQWTFEGACQIRYASGPVSLSSSPSGKERSHPD